MRIYNGTPHAINIVVGAEFNPSLRKYTGGEIVRSIPSDGALNAKIETVAGPYLDGIPTFEKRIVGCDSLPEGYDVYIVLMLYATAHGQTETGGLYTVADPVMSADGATFVGCRGIQKF